MSLNLKDDSNSKGWTATRNILLWSHARGSLQYDIICALILLFIFLVPRSCFISKKSNWQVNQIKKISTPLQQNKVIQNELN
jgi:hypothetical protein